MAEMMAHEGMMALRVALRHLPKLEIAIVHHGGECCEHKHT